MEDWRIDKRWDKEDNEQLKGQIFLHISFPSFWHHAYKTKNNFYHYVFDEAKRHVKLFGRYEEYLEGDRCREFFHRNCCFCLKPIATDMYDDCYCSTDGSYWVCSECFNEFNEKFQWKAIEGVEDIPAVGFTKLNIQ